MESQFGYEAMSSAIINANGGVVYDMNGSHLLKGSDNPFYDRDIDEYGYVSWWGAVAFINYLNSIDYGGSNQWMLPTSNDAADNSSQFGQLFYDEGLNVTNYIWNDSLGRYVLDSPFKNN